MDEVEDNELFEAYTEDFNEKIIEIQDFFDVLVSETEKTPILNRINGSLKILKNIYERIDDQIVSKPNSEKLKNVGIKLKQQLIKYNSKYEEFKIEEDKRLLFEDKNEEVTKELDFDNLEKESLVKRQRNLENTSLSISKSIQIVSETEEVGIGIIQNLGNQREQINSQIDKVDIINSTMRIARSIIDRMEGREMYLKVIIVVLVLVNMGMFSFTAYLYLNKTLKKK
eukprot:gene4258-7594_t